MFFYQKWRRTFKGGNAMGEIKSALELALERTKDIPSDTKGLEKREALNKGKKAAGTFLETNDAKVLTYLNQEPESLKQTCIEGAIINFLAMIRLPQAESEIKKIELIGQGLSILLPDSNMDELFEQVKNLFMQYLQTKAQTEQALQQQFMPRLKAKQQEMAKRYGQNIEISAQQDPEFVNALSRQYRALDSQYEEVILQIRDRIKDAAGIAIEEV